MVAQTFALNRVFLGSKTCVPPPTLCLQEQVCLFHCVVLWQHKTMLGPGNTPLRSLACVPEPHSCHLSSHRHHACVQAPCLIERNNKFYLFYSGNDYGSQHYAVGVAIAEQVTGEGWTVAPVLCACSAVL